MKMGMEMHLKCVHKSTSLIIILNTIIKIFSEDSIIVKCMQFTLWCIHGDNVYKMSREEIVCDFERSSNHVVYNFIMCDSQTLCRIFLCIAKVFMVVKYLITISHICLICMFRGAKLFVIFLDCLRELIRFS